MLSLKWQYLTEENVLQRENVYQISTINAVQFDDKGFTSRIEIISYSLGSFCAIPHVALKQRLYVMNENGKTLSSYTMLPKPAANTNPAAKVN